MGTAVTPMMQQYRDAKARHPDMLLLFRMGDFYEMFEEDAERAGRVLGLKVTSRDKAIAMAGFPHHSLEVHLRKLLQHGLRVAICEQVEDPALARGLVRREVTRVVTPGTITEDNLLDPQRSNYLVAVHPSGSGLERVAGLAWLESSTGDFWAADVPWARLADELLRLAPPECLCAERDGGELTQLLPPALSAMTITQRADWHFETSSARTALHRHFQVATLSGFGFADDQPCLNAAGALLLYAQETLMAELVHIRRLKPYHSERYLLLDEVTRRSLELTRTLREGERKGSLLAVLDRTVTSMGARLLQEWVVMPLAERGEIEGRLDAVAELVEETALRNELRQALGQAFDLQRLASRVSTGRASPRDLASVGGTLKLLPRIKAKITARRARMLRDLEGKLELCSDLRELLDAALAENPPLSPREGGVIRAGYDAELDELRGIARGGKEWIARFQADEATRTGIPSLKVGFNQVFGYYIEITHTHREKIPSDYQRKQTLKNAERYITPELKEYEEKVLTAEEKSQQREYDIFTMLRNRVAEQTVRLLQTAEVLATLDVLASLAELAAARQYVRPELSDEPILDICEGRHPVLDQALPPGMFVPNEVLLCGADHSAGSPLRVPNSTPGDPGMFWLITGPNMSGKSTFIRQVAVLTLMAHLGSFVPASAARVGITDRIFTRVGASDELSRGHSTFMVEMTEAANILNNATERSLVILDEIGRGTSTYDGVSLAWAITEYLHNQVGCRTLFATHYHELAQLAETLPGLRNYNVLVRECEDDIIFLHKIAAGSANKSYGIHVARLAGVPGQVLERANEVLAELESHHLDEELPNPKRRRRIRIKEVQPTLFADLEK